MLGVILPLKLGGFGAFKSLNFSMFISLTFVPRSLDYILVLFVVDTLVLYYGCGYLLIIIINCINN